MKKADMVPDITLIKEKSVTILKGKLVEVLLFLIIKTRIWVLVNQKSHLKDTCIAHTSMLTQNINAYLSTNLSMLKPLSENESAVWSVNFLA